MSANRYRLLHDPDADDTGGGWHLAQLVDGQWVHVTTLWTDGDRPEAARRLAGQFLTECGETVGEWRWDETPGRPARWVIDTTAPEITPSPIERVARAIFDDRQGEGTAKELDRCWHGILPQARDSYVAKAQRCIDIYEGRS